MSDFRFAEPDWVHLLWPVLGFVVALAAISASLSNVS